MSQVMTGDMVRVHFTGTLEDGTVFASSEGRDPVEFLAGSQEVMPGISHGVVGMQAGETKTVTLMPEEAYGIHLPGLQQTVPRDSIPDDAEVGDQLRATVDDNAIPVWVVKLDEAEAVVDANHPLAGQTVVFVIELEAILPS